VKAFLEDKTVEQEKRSIGSFVSATLWLALILAVLGFLGNCITEGGLGRELGINAPYVRVLKVSRPVGIGLSSEKGIHVLRETDYQVEILNSFKK